MKILDKATSLHLTPVILLLALGAPAMFAQDSSGNALLNGNYRFRYVATVNYNQTTGNVTEVTAAEGVITFDGVGTYIIAQGSQYNDNTLNGGKFQSYLGGTQAVTGTYAINPAGIGSIDNPDPVVFNSVGPVFGSFSNGVFTGSSTESGQAVNDMLILIAAGTPTTTASFNSPYWIGALDFALGTDIDVKNALFKISPNGSGGLASISVQGQANNQSQTALTQTISGATYTFGSDGGGTFTFPAPAGVSTPAVMISGTRTLYVSADGNYVLGWTPNGYDIVFGVKALTSTAKDSLFSGLYYTSALNDAPPIGGQAQCGGGSFWGSDHADGAKNEVWHQRTWSPFCSNFSAATDIGQDDGTVMNSDGTATDFIGNLFAFGAGGAGFVAISNPTNDPGIFSLTVGIQATYKQTGSVYLIPWGVVNAGNWQPVTAGVAPGELINLFVIGLTGGTALTPGGTSCSTSLGNVQVTIGGIVAPVCDVIPASGQITVQAPYDLINSTAYTATIQVNSGGVLSNKTSVYLTDANSGFFSAGQNGIGNAIAEHANGTLITTASPAQPGETIILAVAGMGTVTPNPGNGAIGPSNPLSYTDNFNNKALFVLFNDYVNGSTSQLGTIGFAGLYPGFVGLYQMNVTVPTTVGPNTNPGVYLEVITDNADVLQVTIPVSGTAAAAVSDAQPHVLINRGGVTSWRSRHELRTPQAPQTFARKPH